MRSQQIIKMLMSQYGNNNMRNLRSDYKMGLYFQDKVLCVDDGNIGQGNKSQTIDFLSKQIMLLSIINTDRFRSQLLYAFFPQSFFLSFIQKLYKISSLQIISSSFNLQSEASTSIIQVYLIDFEKVSFYLFFITEPSMDQEVLYGLGTITDLKKKMTGKTLAKSHNLNQEKLTEFMDTIQTGIQAYPGMVNMPQLASKQIKQTLDKKEGPIWQCIIGQGFAYDISVQSDAFLLMYYNGSLGCLIFKT